jgi:F-type H+-transporting ATPase subunit delta
MAELATIARPYAEALFQVVKADAASAVAWLDGLAIVAADARLQQYAHDPKTSHARCSSCLPKLGQKTFHPWRSIF